MVLDTPNHKHLHQTDATFWWLLVSELYLIHIVFALLPIATLISKRTIMHESLVENCHRAIGKLFRDLAFPRIGTGRLEAVIQALAVIVPETQQPDYRRVLPFRSTRVGRK